VERRAGLTRNGAQCAERGAVRCDPHRGAEIGERVMFEVGVGSGETVVVGDGGRVVGHSVGRCAERHGRGTERSAFLTQRHSQAEASGATTAAADGRWRGGGVVHRSPSTATGGASMVFTKRIGVVGERCSWTWSCAARCTDLVEAWAACCRAALEDGAFSPGFGKSMMKKAW
jgi:hypothetical protein